MSEPLADVERFTCGEDDAMMMPQGIVNARRRRPRRVVYYYDDEVEVEEVFATPPKQPVGPENPRIGSPTPMGFCAFGITTLLFNVHNAKIAPLNTATMGLVIFYGGLTQFVAGWFELINMNTFGCTISTSYGAFWIATASLFLQEQNDYVTMGDHTFSGGFFLLWFVFATALFAASFRSPLMCMLLFLSVSINFFLQSIGFFLDSRAMAVVAGYEGIWVGSLALYIGLAFTLRDVYGKSILPLFFHKNFRDITA